MYPTTSAQKQVPRSTSPYLYGLIIILSTIFLRNTGFVIAIIFVSIFHNKKYKARMESSIKIKVAVTYSLTKGMINVLFFGGLQNSYRVLQNYAPNITAAGQTTLAIFTVIHKVTTIAFDFILVYLILLLTEKIYSKWQGRRSTQSPSV